MAIEKFEDNVSAETFTEALAQKRVLIVGVKFTRNGWTRFRVYIVNSRSTSEREEWEPLLKPVRVQCANSVNAEYGWEYASVAWGMDRRYEVIHNIARALGINGDRIHHAEWIQG